MARLEPVDGTEIIEDMRLGHTWHEVDVLRETIKIQNAQWFVEIGIHEGGLAYILNKEYPWMKYLGVELYMSVVQNKARSIISKNNNTILYGSCFTNRIRDTVKLWMPEGKGIIYCDNGNKPEELKFYAPIVRSGDILMAHDYFHPKERIARDWPEIDNPEVTKEDVEFLRNDAKFVELEQPDFTHTRIIAFMRK